jgi:hypothetical protein
MAKMGFYHVRALLWTYLVWAVLTLLLAYAIWDDVSGPFVHKAPLGRMPYYWGLLHIFPFSALWVGDSIASVVGLYWGSVGLFLVVVGLLIRERWACLLVILGVNLWFFVALLLFSIGK